MRFRASGNLADEKVEQVPLPPVVNDLLARFIRPAHHLDRSRPIVCHQVDDVADRDAREQFVQFDEDRRTLRPDFDIS